MRVAVIGAGWTGLGVLRVLRDAGHTVEVFEAYDDVGGVWHPQNAYAGFSIHSPSRQIELPDHPLPPEVDRAERISAGQVFDYVRDACRRFDLYRHITFGVRVTAIDHRSGDDGAGPRVAITLSTGETRVFDHCVCTAGYTRPRVPDFPERARFEGELIHLFQARPEVIEAAVRAGKRIGIIGGSKAAADMVQACARYGYRVEWFYRAPYWFLDFDRGAAAERRRVERGRRVVHWFTALFALGMLLGGRWPRLVFWLWRLNGVIHTYDPRPAGFEKFHFGLLGRAEMALLRTRAARAHRTGIAGFTAEGIRRDDGQVVPVDLVICCTGSGEGAPRFEVRRDGAPVDMTAIDRVYVGRVVPALPRLVFTAYHAFSFGMVNGLTYGHWLLRYIEADLDPQTLAARAVTTPFPFFTRPTLFDSSRPMLPAMHAVNDQIYAEGYTTARDYARWVLREIAFAHQGSAPLQFSRPRPKEAPPG